MDVLKLCADCGEYTIDDNHECDLSDTNNEDLNLESPQLPLIETTFTEVQNIEELINEVFIRTPLWDSTLPYEKRGPSVTKLLWSEIDKRLNLCPGTANVKWRHLRDTYVRKLNEQKKYIPSGSGAEAKIKPVSWPYFELLGFLRPTVMRRKTFSNINPSASCSTNNEKRYSEQPLEKLNRTSVMTYNRSNSNKNCAFSGEGYITSSPSDTGISETSLQENVNYCNQHKFRAVTSDYSLMQQNVNSIMKIEESEISKNIPSSTCKNTAMKNLKMSAGKKRRMNTNKENDELSLFQQSILSEIKATDKSINDTSDPVMAFCNYLTTQLRTLSQDNFTKCQRKILSLVFELQDN